MPTDLPAGFRIDQEPTNEADTMLVAYGKPERFERRLGSIILSFYPNKGEMAVEGIGVGEKYQRRGIGTKLYETAAAYAREHGYVLTSDTARTKSSEGFWAKQYAKGRADAVPVGPGHPRKPPDAVSYYKLKREAHMSPLSGATDVVLTHRIEGDTLFVEAFDPTGIKVPYDLKESAAYWGKPNQVGLLVMRLEGRTKMWARDVRIVGGHQRQGLAARMYRYAQKVAGRTAKPSSDQTDAGKAMWKSFKREGTLRKHW